MVEGGEECVFVASNQNKPKYTTQTQTNIKGVHKLNKRKILRVKGRKRHRRVVMRVGVGVEW